MAASKSSRVCHSVFPNLALQGVALLDACHDLFLEKDSGGPLSISGVRFVGFEALSRMAASQRRFSSAALSAFFSDGAIQCIKIYPRD